MEHWLQGQKPLKGVTEVTAAAWISIHAKELNLKQIGTFECFTVNHKQVYTVRRLQSLLLYRKEKLFLLEELGVTQQN